MPTMTHALPQGANAALCRLAARRSAKQGRRTPNTSVTKDVVRRIYQRNAPNLPITKSQRALLDHMIGTTKKRDWTDGWALCYASNARLARVLNVTEAHISHMLRGLETQGIIVRDYSPNGKRHATRDAAERIVSGHGIDLTPIMDLLEEWEKEADAAEEQNNAHWQRATAITTKRVTLRAGLADFEGCGIDEEIEEIVGQLDRAFPTNLHRSRTLRRRDEAELAALEAELDDVESQFAYACSRFVDGVEIRTPVTSEPNHHTRTNLHPNLSTQTVSASAEPSINWPSASSEKKRADQAGIRLDPALLSTAFPLFWQYMDDPEQPTVYELQAVAQHVLPDIGLRQSVWAEWKSKLGPVLTAMIVALTYERARTTGPNRLDDPSRAGGYFVACARRAELRELFLEASVHACARRNLAAIVPDPDDELI